MKILINLTLELTDEQVGILTRIAKECGHDFDNTNKPRTLIKRYLEGKVSDAVNYCHEHLDKD